MENEIMGSIKDKDSLINQIKIKITRLEEQLLEQASKVSEEKMKYPTSDMIAFTNEDNWNYKEYSNIKPKIEKEIEELKKQLIRLSPEDPKV